MMSKEKKPFQSILDDDDDSDLETLALKKGVGKLIKPSVSSQNPPSQPEPVSANTSPRTVMRPIKLDVPDYVWEELKIQSVTDRCSMRYIIMKALKASGYNIREEDMVEDGRALRGKKKIGQ